MDTSALTPSTGTELTVALPEPLQAQVEWLRRRHGLDEVTASLMALSAVLGACGASRRLLNPADLTTVAPSMALVISGSTPRLASALNLVVDPIRQWMLRRIGNPDRRQDNQRRLEIAGLHEQLVHLNLTLERALQPPPPGMERMMLDQGELRERVRGIEAERDAVSEKIEDRAFRLAPYFLVDDPPLAALLDPGKLCLDGGLLHLSTGGDWISAIRRQPGRMKAELSGLLARSWRGLPDHHDDRHVRPTVSSLIVVNPQEADALWGRELTRYHLPDQFFHVADTSDAGFDLDADCPDDEPWTAGIQALVNTRLKSEVINYQLSAEAVSLYQAQLNGISAPPSRSAERRALLTLKLALLIHLASARRDQLEIGDDTFKAGCELAARVCEATAESIRQREVPRRSARPGGVERLIATLKRRGPLTWRQLLRSSHSQKARTLRGQLNKAIKSGRIFQEGGLYGLTTE